MYQNESFHFIYLLELDFAYLPSVKRLTHALFLLAAGYTDISHFALASQKFLTLRSRTKNISTSYSIYQPPEITLGHMTDFLLLYAPGLLKPSSPSLLFFSPSSLHTSSSAIDRLQTQQNSRFEPYFNLVTSIKRQVLTHSPLLSTVSCGLSQ